jgi:RHS repeat-associated protein
VADNSYPHIRRRRVAFMVACIATAMSLVAGLLAATGVLGGGPGAPASAAGAPVAVHPVHGRPAQVPRMPSSSRPRTSWPAAGAGTAVLAAGVRPRAAGLEAGPSAGSGRAGSLPLWVGPADLSTPTVGKGASTSAVTARPVSRVQAGMAGRATVAALGVHGVVFSVARADGATASSRVHVSVDYASFADASGGNYASRLHLVELPACALTSPQLAKCRVQTPVRTADNTRADQAGADVTLPGTATAAARGGTGLTARLTSAASAAPAVLALTATASGSGGNFAAEPYSEADAWVTGDSSGAFTYSSPISVPPVPGGLEPEVSLDYNSQATDGLTSSTNNEASWVGDGWDYSPGYIEVDYPSCSSLVLAPPTGDLCPGPEQTILSRNGVQSPIVAGSKGTLKAEADGGEEVLDQTSPLGQSYWEVIEPDGTQYYYGLNQLPGYVSGDPTTNSVWTVPVGSETEPWRYMLDYVVDPHGNAIAYFYNTQTNYYAQDDGTTGSAAYTQGGTLTKIEYGLRTGSAYSSTPAGQVTFTTSSTVRTDAPTDLACAHNAACTVTSPTFWTSYALTGISTQALVSGSLHNVDSWSLADTYPATGDTTTSPSLWLSSVTRTGQDGSTAISLPPVSFAGKPMPNRVQTAADTAAGYSQITRYRLTSITSDTGEVTSAAYSTADTGACATSGSFPSPYANTANCYPDYWRPTGSSSPVEDWFNLYALTKVTDQDTTGGDPPVVTSYSYAGAAWHYDADTTSRSATETYDQWRGFRTVTTEAGTAPDPVTQTTDTYFQGMNDDPGGINTAPVEMTSTRGDQLYDLDQYAGMEFESIVYTGAGTGQEVTDTVDIPYTSTATATSSTLDQASYITGTTSEDTYTTLATGGTRESTVANTYNAYGQVLTKSDVPDTSNAAEDTCTTYTYATNTQKSVWLVDLPSEVNVVALPCSTHPTLASQVISDTLYSYDGGGLGTPTTGNVTEVQQATSVSTGLLLTYGYATELTRTYDEYGRVLTSTDADSRKTTTVYTPATGAEPTSQAVTDPAGLTTTTSYDPARNLVTGVIDPGSYQTATTYDSLGRQTADWTPGHPTSGPAVDTYAYTVSATAPTVTTEKTEEPGGGYLTTDTLDDSLGQVREIQQATAGGSTDIADTSYNSDGWKALTSDPYYVSGAPSGTLVAAASSSVPSQTGYAYDGDGRVVKQISYALGAETWETDTTYGGNYVTTVPPTGGTSETAFTDGRNLTTAIYQYHAGTPASPTDPAADYDQTSYTYTPAQQLASIKDAASNTWSDTYDMLGHELTATDPDAGKTTNTYDAAGQVMTVTDARGKQVSFVYDGDGRKTAEYDTTGGATESSADELASWTWDTLVKGQLTSSTANSGGSAYTEAVTGYNSYEKPSGTQTVIPAAQGALAGTYTQQDSYAPDGQLTSYTDSAAGGLPAETVSTGYDAAGEPTSLQGTSTYVGSLSYTTLGEPLQYSLGTSAEPAYVTDSYDPQTRNLTEQKTQTGTAQTPVDDLHYSYNNVGDVTAEADTPSGATSATDVQCFQYDYLRRLTQAWAQGSATCAATPSASAEGGAAPYWDSYGYNTVGDLTGITATSAAGAVTTTADSYPAAGSAQPHAVTASKVTTSSTSTSTSYGYDASGELTTVSGSIQSQALTWNDAGQLSQDTVTPAGGSAALTSYIYDADGTLLLTADPGTTTLYLPDEELSLNTATHAVTGTRYYALGGVTVATRTGAAAVSYLAGDTQGTESVAISASSLAVTRRYYDPYGNARGTVPASFPAGEKGFVGGAADTATGLTDLGAREYQPSSGSFISPDPLLTPYNPQDLNAYAYAADNPSTNSDPSGALMITGGSGGCVGSAQADEACNHKAQQEAASNKPRGYNPPPGSGSARVCDGYTCASVAYFRQHPDNPAAHKSPPVHKSPPARSDVVCNFSASGKGACFAPPPGSQGNQSVNSAATGTLGIAGLIAAFGEAPDAGLLAAVQAVHDLLGIDTIPWDRRTSAAVRALTSDLRIIDVYGSTIGFDSNQQKLIAKNKGIIAPSNLGHAEINALAYVLAQGWGPIAGAASRGVCPECQNVLMDLGAKMTGPLVLINFLNHRLLAEKIFRWW